MTTYQLDNFDSADYTNTDLIYCEEFIDPYADEDYADTIAFLNAYIDF
jgi:hypothetical protein